jgi:hypothetical protein
MSQDHTPYGHLSKEELEDLLHRNSSSDPGIEGELRRRYTEELMIGSSPPPPRPHPVVHVIHPPHNPVPPVPAPPAPVTPRMSGCAITCLIFLVMAVIAALQQ